MKTLLGAILVLSAIGLVVYAIINPPEKELCLYEHKKVSGTDIVEVSIKPLGMRGECE